MVNRLAERLEAERRKRDLGVNEFAAELGISHSLLSRYLNGKSSPSRRTVRKLAAGLRAKPAEIEALLPDQPELPTVANPTRAVPPTFLPDRLPPGWKADVREAVLEGMRAVQAESAPPKADELRRRRRGSGGISIPRIDSLRASATRASGTAPNEYVYFDPPDDAGEVVEGRYIQIRVYGECLAPEIVDRDEVVVDRHVERREGDIVLAWHDDDLLVKRLAIIDGVEYLVAEGARHRIDDSTRIEGVAISVVRKIERGPLISARKRR